MNLGVRVGCGHDVGCSPVMPGDADVPSQRQLRC